MPGVSPDEQDIVDIDNGTEGYVLVPDDDGDHTEVDWRISNPHIVGSPDSAYFYASDWPIGNDLTITFDRY